MANEGSKAVLRLLQTTDLHGRLYPYAYAFDRPRASVGLDNLIQTIEQLRCPGSLLFDCGDFLEGTPVSETPGPDNPMITSLNALGYDGVTLGNHEFNFGMPFLRTALSGLTPPVVTSNLKVDPPLGAPILWYDADIAPDLPSARVAVLGVAPPVLTKWNSTRIGDEAVEVDEILDRLTALLPQTKAADVVLVLAHSGIDPEEKSSENMAAQIAGLDGVDAVFCGHIHMMFPGPDFPKTEGIDPESGHIYGTPVVMAGAHGSYLGVIDLQMEYDSAQGWSIVGSEVRLEIGRGQASDRLPASVRKRHVDVLEENRRVIGATDQRLHSAFSVLGPDAVGSIVARAHVQKTQELLKGRPEADLPVLAAIAPYLCGGQFGLNSYIDIARGPLLAYHLQQLYVFPDDLRIVEMNGAGLRLWLEQCASQFGEAIPGQRRSLLEGPSYQIDTLYGLTYQIALGVPPAFDSEGRPCRRAGQRIRDLCYEGRPVADSDRFIVATNSYRVGAAPPITAVEQGRHIKTELLFIRDMLRDHIGAGKLDTSVWPVWSFASVPGAEMVFNTARFADGIVPTDPGLCAAEPGDHGQERMILCLDPLAQARRSA